MKLIEVEKYVTHRFEKEWNPHYEYHNLDHTLDVVNSSEKLARLEGVSERNIVLLRTAAYLHDVGILVQFKEHEKHSIYIAQEILPDLNYSQENIDVISDLIRFTQMPQRSGNNLQQIICDADLDYLGRRDYLEISSRLRREWSNLCLHDYTDIQWYEFQLKFMSNHDYFTASARSIRNETKAKNVDNLQTIIETLS